MEEPDPRRGQGGEGGSTRVDGRGGGQEERRGHHMGGGSGGQEMGFSEQEYDLSVQKIVFGS